VTETLVHEALHRGPFKRVLDLGTGSGCILISLLAAWPEALGVGTDISTAALEVAHRNASQIGVGSRARFQQAEWFAGLEGPFDLIVSNPPYIAEHEMEDLSPEVRDHEPRCALTPGGDGLQAYRDIGAGAKRMLTENGWLMLEIGPTQSESVAAILAGSGLIVHSIIPDIDQRPRVIVGKV
jgi:release factor glutamine methyltransferase